VELGAAAIDLARAENSHPRTQFAEAAKTGNLSAAAAGKLLVVGQRTLVVGMHLGILAETEGSAVGIAGSAAGTEEPVETEEQRLDNRFVTGTDSPAAAPTATWREPELEAPTAHTQNISTISVCTYQPFASPCQRSSPAVQGGVRSNRFCKGRELKVHRIRVHGDRITMYPQCAVELKVLFMRSDRFRLPLKKNATHTVQQLALERRPAERGWEGALQKPDTFNLAPPNNIHLSRRTRFSRPEAHR
jgi:hypothetical protein